MKLKPIHKHDCEECIFLGSIISSYNVDVDLYFCQKQNPPTVIARYSNKGPDYASGLGFNITEINIAKQLASARGLLKDDNNKQILGRVLRINKTTESTGISLHKPEPTIKEQVAAHIKEKLRKIMDEI